VTIREMMGTVENHMMVKERRVLEKVVEKGRIRNATSVERMDIVLLSVQRVEKSV
jgi:heterodisulfide reductase subunit C